jgi:CheY-like chemotaxis protein
MEVLAVRRVRIPVASAGVPDPPVRRPTVLLVTGDANLRDVAARVLECDGYHVLAAAHSGHALLAGMTSTRIDALAAELSMDEMSGPALAERLRRHHPGLRALYFGQSATPECGNVLVRPFTRDDLLTRLERLVGCQR